MREESSSRKEMVSGATVALSRMFAALSTVSSLYIWLVIRLGDSMIICI